MAANDFESALPLDYDQFVDEFYEQGVEHSPAYLQGGLCGVLAGGFDGAAEDCLGAAGQALELEVRGAMADLGVQLAAATRAAMLDEEFDFQLFLPDDEEPMPVRLGALGDWCRGFLAGFALAIARPGGDDLGSEVAEILRDIAAVAEVDPEPAEDQPEEDAEQDYFELTEYLRFAALNLFQDRLSEAGDGG